MTAVMTETLYRCSRCGAVDTWDVIEAHGCAGRMEAVLGDPDCQGGRTVGDVPAGTQAAGHGDGGAGAGRAAPASRDEVSDNRAMYIAPTPEELREVRKRNRFAAGVVTPPALANTRPPTPEQRAMAKAKLDEAREILARAKHPDQHKET